MSMINCSRHIAVFRDSTGHQVGTKIFDISWFSSSIGLSKKYFFYKDKAYNIKPSLSSRIDTTLFRKLLFDDYFYIYDINNPDPIEFLNGGFCPIMNPEDYKQRLESNLVDALNRAGRGKFQINWKWIIALIVIALIAYYFISGGSILPGTAEAVNSTASEAIRTNSTGKMIM